MLPGLPGVGEEIRIHENTPKVGDVDLPQATLQGSAARALASPFKPWTVNPGQGCGQSLKMTPQSVTASIIVCERATYSRQQLRGEVARYIPLGRYNSAFSLFLRPRSFSPPLVLLGPNFGLLVLTMTPELQSCWDRSMTSNWTAALDEEGQARHRKGPAANRERGEPQRDCKVTNLLPFLVPCLASAWLMQSDVFNLIARHPSGSRDAADFAALHVFWISRGMVHIGCLAILCYTGKGSVCHTFSASTRITELHCEGSTPFF